jgi:ATP-dependent protease ClpP protease subunit
MAVLPLPPRSGSDKPKIASGYRVIRNAKGDAAEIYIYGQIGSAGWFSDGTEITAAQFQKDLKALGDVKTIDVRINSEGGDVWDGKTIYTLLQQHPAKVAMHIDGLAASAASFIAMAGNTIEIAESSFMMIHNAWSFAIGNAADLRKSADLLEAVDGTLADVYAARTKLPVKDVSQMMADETWMDGKTCVAKGFADTICPNMAVAASVRHADRFKNLPPVLRPNRAAASAALDKMAALIRR